MAELAPESCHEHLLDSVPRLLEYHPGRDLYQWRQEVGEKFRELVGFMPEKVPLNVSREFERENELFRETRFVFTSEAHADVPCHLLIPRRGSAPFPVVVCPQGHSTGMHISLGRPKHAGDEESIHGGDRDFALQAVRQGYAALAVEQRCFGERKDNRLPGVHSFDHGCRHAAMTSLLLGRTMIGERVWDVSRAIDALDEFPEIDRKRIGCVGNSGGGTITYYAACLDERIGIAMPSCSVCTFRDAIAKIDHCEDNYIPSALTYFEMGDLAGLITPRPLIVVTGRDDPIFPIRGVEEACDTIRRIYAAAGVPDHCRLIVGEGGHRFYADLAWPVFRELADWCA